MGDDFENFKISNEMEGNIQISDCWLTYSLACRRILFEKSSIATDPIRSFLRIPILF